MHNFFSTIIYSSANEDPASELEALQLTSDDTVLTITGSGSRALDLLIASPKKVISVDMNETQTFLLALKCSAYKNLNYFEFKKFIGLETCDQRLSVYEIIKNDLSEEAQRYWQQQSQKIAKGILYCGVWESYLLKLSWLTRYREKLIKQLFNADSLEAQKNIFQQQWDGFLWQQFIKVLNIRWVWKYLLKEPGIDLIDSNLHIGHYIHQRLEHTISTQMAINNPFLNLIIFGKYNSQCLPLHLQEQYFEKIKASIDTIQPMTMPLEECLKAHPNSIDAFSISDFSSYANPQQYKAIWQSIMIAGKDKARVCERFFLVNYHPETLEGINIKRNKALEEKLRQEDHSFIYSFNCATIHK